MIVGIHYDPLYQFPDRLIRYEKILKHNNIDVIRLSSSSSDFWKIIPQMDLFIYHFGHLDISKQNAQAVLPVIENEYKIPCYPDHRTSWAFDDKIREYYLMHANNLPMVESWIFWEKREAQIWAESPNLPVIFKLSGGAGSNNVILIKSRSVLNKIIEKMFSKGISEKNRFGTDSLKKNGYERLKGRILYLKRKMLDEFIDFRHIKPNWKPHKNYVYFQKFLPENHFDTRVVVIGDKAFAFRRMNRKDDFRSSGSGNNDVSSDNIDLNHIKKAFEVSKKMKFQSMAYDFLYDENGNSVFCEMSYTCPDRTLFSCPGYWNENLSWQPGHYWPQYILLDSLLKHINLKQPDDLQIVRNN